MSPKPLCLALFFVPVFPVPVTMIPQPLLRFALFLLMVLLSPEISMPSPVFLSALFFSIVLLFDDSRWILSSVFFETLLSFMMLLSEVNK